MSCKTAKMAETILSLDKGNTQLFQSVNNLQQNLNFMNQLNQLANYVQIPLKMTGQDTTGELYVYTNKKHLAQNDGNVSAFLHLDMEHLGAVDVYVAMQNSNHVNTKFYLQDESLIDFMKENIHILNDRLEQRGYLLNSSITEREEGRRFDVLDEVKTEQKESGSMGKMIAAYAFDVRA